jgi:hypothetical protein
MHIGLQYHLEYLKGRNHSEDVGCRWKDNIKVDPAEYVVTIWTGFIYLRTGSSYGLL